MLTSVRAHAVAQVLSVVSSQIKQIQEALKNELTRFQFEGKEIALNARTGALSLAALAQPLLLSPS